MRSFGTDGEIALVDAFKHVFHFATHFICFIHVCRNIKDELQRWGFPEDVAGEMLDDVFGKKVSSTFMEDLVDANNASSFYKELNRLEEV